MKAPRPTLRSSTSAEVPLATFLAMMLAAMSPSLLDGAGHVAQRVEEPVGRHDALALAHDGDADALELPHELALRQLHAKAGDRLELVEGAAGVTQPAPGHLAEHARRRRRPAAPATSVTLSPTPPLECLSSTGRRTARRSSVLPLSTMARASSTVSASLRPRSTIAMSRALAWYEGTAPETTPLDEGAQARRRRARGRRASRRSRRSRSPRAAPPVGGSAVRQASARR